MKISNVTVTSLIILLILFISCDESVVDEMKGFEPNKAPEIISFTSDFAGEYPNPGDVINITAEVNDPDSPGSLSYDFSSENGSFSSKAITETGCTIRFVVGTGGGDVIVNLTVTDNKNASASSSLTIAESNSSLTVSQLEPIPGQYIDVTGSALISFSANKDGYYAVLIFDDNTTELNEESIKDKIAAENPPFYTYTKDETATQVIYGPLQTNTPRLTGAGQWDKICIVVKDLYGNIAWLAMDFISSDEAPVPGNNGLLSVYDITPASLRLKWDKASDAVTAQNLLQYRVYYSASNNISTISEADTGGNGAEITSGWTFDRDFIDVGGLNQNTLYYFNVFVKDGDNNVSSYSTAFATTRDGTAPMPGGDPAGTLTASNIQQNSLELNWTKGSDPGTAQADLEYRVYYSTSNNIATVSAVEANGIPSGDWIADISTKAITGLIQNTSYYFNVLIRDSDGNKSSYTSLNITTTANTAPVAGNSGTISVGATTVSTVDLSWTAATDDTTSQTLLEYRIYKSLTSNIADVNAIELNGTPIADWAANIASATVGGLTDGTEYFFNILARDSHGNKTAYSMATASTVDNTPPVPGNSGQINIDQTTNTSIKLSWDQASDAITLQTSIIYSVYYSTSQANINNTIANIEASATLAVTNNNISDYTISPLAPNTVYYYTVIVADTAGNKAKYNFGFTNTAAYIYLYASSNTYNGRLLATGYPRSDADSICISEYSSLYTGLNCSSSIKGFISIHGSDEIRDMPTVYFTPTNKPIHSGPNISAKIADNWTDLLDGSVDQSLAGAGIMGAAEIYWTGSRDTGAVLNHCDYWTNFGTLAGTYGTASETGAFWLDSSGYSYPDDTRECSNSLKILCICW